MITYISDHWIADDKEEKDAANPHDDLTRAVLTKHVGKFIR